MSANLSRFDGVAESYDRSRPSPPAVLTPLLLQVAETEYADLVVDLGSGTGLSTIIWSPHSASVIGIEPNADMRKQAEISVSSASGCGNISFHDGLGSSTGLPDNCADIVTASQSLHWMDPEPTFAEVARILRPGGIFAAYDCKWPPLMRAEAEQAIKSVMDTAQCLQEKLGVYAAFKSWSKDEHRDRMIACGRFSDVREVSAGSLEQGNAQRLVRLAFGLGGIAALLKSGVSEKDLQIDRLREVADRVLGNELSYWYFSYTIRIAVK